MVSSKSLIGIVALASRCQASFVIPPNLSDGVHIFSKDANGTQAHEKISALQAPPQAWMENHSSARGPRGPAGHVARDDNPNPQCDSDAYGIDRNDLGQAQYQLEGECKSGLVVGAKSAAVGMKGDVVTYFCNQQTGYKGNPQVAQCNSAVLDSDITAVQNTCRGTGGWVNHPGQWRSYGYTWKRTDGSGKLVIC